MPKPEIVVLSAETVMPYLLVETISVFSGPFADLRVSGFAMVRVSL